MEWEPRDPPEGINVTPTHPLGELATLLGGIVIITLVVALAGGVLIDVGLQYLPPGVESRLFGGFLSDWFEDAEDARVQPAGELLARLAAHWPDNPYNLRLRILEEETPNAFAIPGGLVVLTSGLLDDVKSENELAFVLGHELGHFAERHHLRGLGRGLVLQVGMSVVLGGSASEKLPMLIAELADSRFARDHEREADRFGLELVFREYGHVGGADAFFRRLPDAKAGLGDRLGSYMASHPVSEDRIEALDEVARERGYPTEGEQVPFAVEPAP